MDPLADRRILIAGAGYVGQALIPRLLRRGAAVFALGRLAHGSSFGETRIVADVSVPESLAGLPPDLDFVVYLVGPDHGSDDAYRTAYVTGLAQVLAAPPIRAAQVARIVFASSTAVYAQSDGSWVDESSPTQPVAFNGKRLLEAEQVLKRSGLPGTSLRFAGIYGPGRQRLLDQVLTGQARLGPDSSFSNRIHREDAAGIIEHLLGLETVADVYLGVDNEPAELNDVLCWLASATGNPTPPSDSVRSARTRGGNKRCSNRRLLETGYRLSYPSFREGYRALIGELR